MKKVKIKLNIDLDIDCGPDDIRKAVGLTAEESQELDAKADALYNDEGTLVKEPVEAVAEFTEKELVTFAIIGFGTVARKRGRDKLMKSLQKDPEKLMAFLAKQLEDHEDN